jgi:hypothetical protein
MSYNKISNIKEFKKNNSVAQININLRKNKIIDVQNLLNSIFNGDNLR